MIVKMRYMLGFVRSSLLNQSRSYKNFGHKRQPEALFTILWHGFLTFSFIGLGLNWKWISKTLIGIKVDEDLRTPLDK